MGTWPTWTADMRKKILALVEPFMVPGGGATGQILTKKSGADHDADWVTGSGGGGVTDHGLLDAASLLDDDHPQYHNDARGNAKYYQQSEVDTFLAGKSDDPHDHSAAETISGEFADARISESSVTQHGGAINHDTLMNFDAGEHRIINDVGAAADELFSAFKILAELSGKSDTSHGHVTGDTQNLDDLLSSRKLKASDESRTSDTTMSDDADLITQVLAANSEYRFTIDLYWEADAANDIKWRLSKYGSGLSGATMYFRSDLNSELVAAKTFDSLVAGGGLGAGTVLQTTMKGVIITGSSTGQMVLQWAQVTSGAVATIIKQGSNIIIDRLDV